MTPTAGEGFSTPVCSRRSSAARDRSMLRPPLTVSTCPHPSPLIPCFCSQMLTDTDHHDEKALIVKMSKVGACRKPSQGCSDDLRAVQYGLFLCVWLFFLHAEHGEEEKHHRGMACDIILTARFAVGSSAEIAQSIEPASLTRELARPARLIIDTLTFACPQEAFSQRQRDQSFTTSPHA